MTGLERAEWYLKFGQWWRVRNWGISSTEKEKEVWDRGGGVVPMYNIFGISVHAPSLIMHHFPLVTFTGPMVFRHFLIWKKIHSVVGRLA